MRGNDCHVCSQLHIDPDVLREGLRPDIEDVVNSARHNCTFCSIVTQALYLFIPRPLDLSNRFPEDTRLAIHSSNENGQSLILWVNWTNIKDAVTTNDFMISRVRIELFTLTGQPSPWQVIGACRPLGNEIALETCLQYVPAWIRSCQKNHPECRVPPDTPLPTRVIEIDLHDATLDPRLIETYGKRAPYVALSHCWGLSQPIRTTNSNISRHKDGIPWSSFPATFRDALLLTQGLGICYLWIDSLCIIQDDRKDWEMEAARMAEVYGNSYLTIAASSSPGADAGIFRNSEFKDTITYELTEVSARGFPVSIYARERIQHMKPEEDHPLLTRAWTYQEHLLAKRVLQFSKIELVWECNMGNRCCCTADHLDRGDNGPQRGLSHPSSPKDLYEKSDFSRLLHSRFSDSYLGNLGLEPSRVSIIAIRNEWKLMVGRYMERNLTKLEDRLPALAGVSREVHKIARSEYLAGLWRHDLFAGLLWNCTYQDISFIQGAWRAPSWSWASVESHIDWVSHRLDKRDDGAYVEILEVECHPRTVDPFGAVHQGAFLRLRGKIVDVEFGYDKKRFFPDLCVRQGFRQEFVKDVRRLAPDPVFLYEGDTLQCLLLCCLPDDRPLLLVMREVQGKSCRPMRSFERVGIVTQGFPEAKGWFADVGATEVIMV